MQRDKKTIHHHCIHVQRATRHTVQWFTPNSALPDLKRPETKQPKQCFPGVETKPTAQKYILENKWK